MATFPLTVAIPDTKSQISLVDNCCSRAALGTMHFGTPAEEGSAVVLAVAVGFLLRLALQRGVASTEIVGLGFGGALILSFPYLKTQMGLAAVLIVIALVVQRALLIPPPWSET
jgi:hypothetical protein